MNALPLAHEIGETRSGAPIFLLKVRGRPYLVASEGLSPVKALGYGPLDENARDAEGVGNGELADLYRATVRVNRALQVRYGQGGEIPEGALRLHGPAHAREVAATVKTIQKAFDAGCLLRIHGRRRK